MFVFDITNPITLILILAATILLIFLSQEIKKSYVTVIPLVIFLILLVVHVVQLTSIQAEYSYLISVVAKCIAIDFVFILVCFFSYLWVDDIEAKATGKKSLDNSLDWFWKNV